MCAQKQEIYDQILIIWCCFVLFKPNCKIQHNFAPRTLGINIRLVIIAFGAFDVNSEQAAEKSIFLKDNYHQKQHF
jgi:hypothetical protein